VFKIRIGTAIMLTALAGVAVAPGPAPQAWKIAVLALAVLLSSASAGAFNQFMERDLDARMKRTRHRPFVTGRFVANGYWLAGIVLLLVLAVAAAALATNAIAAMYVFLGAFFYGVVYTVWLKRRTWMNIIIGGLAASFAVLAGAAAVDPGLAPAPVILAVVLFLWTPPHFWSLAFKYKDEYAAAGVPMLPVVLHDATAARIILAHTLLLVGLSLVPALYGLGWIYLLGAVTGGGWFVWTSIRLARNPSPEAAMTNFHASLLQLSLLLCAAILDAWLLQT
jgi:protoheme IX farnesyltransferase